MNSYDFGDTVRLSVAFLNHAGIPADPTGVTVAMKYAVGTAPVTYTYGVGAQVVRDATGAYHCDVELAYAGLLYYRWEGTGAVEAVSEGQLLAKQSNVVAWI